MGEVGEYWRDVKTHYRKKQNRYENKITPLINELIEHPECNKVGDHWRIDGVWDFWWTGTVRNIKTGDNMGIQELAKKFNLLK